LLGYSNESWVQSTHYTPRVLKSITASYLTTASVTIYSN
jgi:hypothetical protein